MAKTVDYLHSDLGIVHGDLAPRCWLIEGEAIVLAEFGEAGEGEFGEETGRLADTFVEMLGGDLARYGRSLNCLLKWMYNQLPRMHLVVAKLELMNSKFDRQQEKPRLLSKSLDMYATSQKTLRKKCSFDSISKIRSITRNQLQINSTEYLNTDIKRGKLPFLFFANHADLLRLDELPPLRNSHGEKLELLQLPNSTENLTRILLPNQISQS